MVASVIEGGVVPASTTQVLQLGSAATGTEVLVGVLVGVAGTGFGDVVFGAGSTRNPLVFNGAAGGTVSVAHIYRLVVDDQIITVPFTSPSAASYLCWAVIDDSNLVPTDWELFSYTVAAGSDPQTVAYTAADVGIQLGVAVIAGQAVAITEPYDWTLIDSAAGDTSVCWAYGEILTPGAQIPEFFTGEVPAGATGETYWFGVYDIGLRLRDGGSWWSASGASVTTPGPAERRARQFPPDPTIPNLPPDPSPIVLPRAPWIPPDGGGPFRVS